MRQSFIALLLISIFLHAGCSTPQHKHESLVSVIDTIGGQKYIISAKIEGDGTFNSSAIKDGRTQSISGKVIKSDNTYCVTVDYSSTQENMPGQRKINSTINLRNGESHAIGGIGSEAVYLKISIQ